MHDDGAAGSVASSGRGHGHAPGCGQAQCPDARGPVVAGGAQHGPGLADSPEPPRIQTAAGNSEANMGGIRPPGRGNRRDQGKPREAISMASMGGGAGDTDATIHPQARSLGGGTPVSVGSVMDLLDRQQYRCALSGRRLTPATAALDHIVSISNGGEHIIENAQVLHKDVNRAKASLTNTEFIGLCREVVCWSDRGRRREVEHGE